jgi:uncharacterized coiled-coil DUF342 family protein
MNQRRVKELLNRYWLFLGVLCFSTTFCLSVVFLRSFTESIAISSISTFGALLSVAILKKIEFRYLLSVESELSYRIQQKNVELDELKQKNSAYISRKTSLETSLSDLSEEFEQATQKKDSIEEKIGEANLTYVNVQEQVQKILSQNSTAQQELQDTQKELQEAQSNLQNTQKGLDTLTENKNVLEDKIYRYQSNLQGLCKELEAYDSQISDLKNQKILLDRNVDDLKSEIANLAKKKTNLESAVNAINSRLQELESKKEGLDTEVAQLDDHKSDLLQSIEEYKEEQSDLEEKIKELNSEYWRLEDKVSALERIVETYKTTEREIEELEYEKQNLEQEANRRSERLSLAERGTKYAISLSMQSINSLWELWEHSVQLYHKCLAPSRDSRRRDWDALSRGTGILRDRKLLLAYFSFYGSMHLYKMNYLLEILFSKGLITENARIDVIDYGCGQAFGTNCLLDYLSRNNLQSFHLDKIHLIEPSDIALERGILHLNYFLNGTYQNPSIIPINKKLESLDLNDLRSEQENLKIHIFSNILDVFEQEVIQNLYEKIQETQRNRNFFICVSPQNENVENITFFWELWRRNNQAVEILANSQDLRGRVWRFGTGRFDENYSITIFPKLFYVDL